MTCAHGGEADPKTNRPPPNTEAAFRAALRLLVECVEVDVARTRDGHLVVLHVRELHQLLAMAPPPPLLLPPPLASLEGGDAMGTGSKVGRKAGAKEGGNSKGGPSPPSSSSSTPSGSPKGRDGGIVKQQETWQVGDLTLLEILALRWQPGGDKVLMVREAVAMVQPWVECVTLDVKTYQDRWGWWACLTDTYGA